jgi:hypothetical protein
MAKKVYEIELNEDFTWFKATVDELTDDKTYVAQNIKGFHTDMEVRAENEYTGFIKIQNIVTDVKIENTDKIAFGKDADIKDALPIRNILEIKNYKGKIEGYKVVV